MALVNADASISAADKGATPLGPNDPIRIASITKAFTAALVPVDFDYTAIATTVWSAGGLVSSVVDVHEFFAALSRGDGPIDVGEPR